MPAFSVKTAFAAGLTVAAIAFSTAPASAMNKQDLVNAIAHDADVSKNIAEKMLDSYVKNIGMALKKGDRVSIVGFGSFSVSSRAARTGRNPQTGKPIKIPAAKVVKFKAGKVLIDQVN